MSVDLHRQAMALVDDAQFLAGEPRRALYRRASAMELDVLRRVPLQRQRTRGIIAVSTVATAYHARSRRLTWLRTWQVLWAPAIGGWSRRDVLLMALRALVGAWQPESVLPRPSEEAR